MNILNTLTSEEKEKYFIYRSYTHNQVVFNEGNICDEIGFILQGEIVITTPSYDEKEETINLLNENSIYGNVLIFSSTPFYLGTAVTRKNTLIAHLSKPNLIKLMQNNQHFLLEFMQYFSNDTLKVKQQSKLLIHKSIKNRLLYYLYEQSKITGSKAIKIISITSLSLTLSIPRPSVSREIKKLSDEGIIKYKSKIITLL